MEQAFYMDIISRLSNSHFYKQNVIDKTSLQSELKRFNVCQVFEEMKSMKTHSINVSELASKIARAMNLSEKEIQQVALAGFLHDIGKVTIPNEILNKNSSLSENERTIVMKHSEAGYNILKSISEFEPIAHIVLEHHERCDGKGYPNGLKNDEIEESTKIISVADAYDAMTNDRVYRKKLSQETAINELMNGAGSQFDAQIVKIFVEKVLPNEKQTEKQF